MTPTYPYFARAVRRLNPLPQQRREWAEQDAQIAERLAASAAIDADAMAQIGEAA